MSVDHNLIAAAAPLTPAQLESVWAWVAPSITHGRAGAVISLSAVQRAAAQVAAEWVYTNLPPRIAFWTAYFAEQISEGIVSSTALDVAMVAAPWHVAASSTRELRRQWRTRGVVPAGRGGIGLAEVVGLWVWRELMGENIKTLPVSPTPWQAWAWAAPETPPRLLSVDAALDTLCTTSLLWTAWAGAAYLPGWVSVSRGAVRWVGPAPQAEVWPDAMPELITTLVGGSGKRRSPHLMATAAYGGWHATRNAPAKTQPPTPTISR
jgi:hypothetical protein